MNAVKINRYTVKLVRETRKAYEPVAIRTPDNAVKFLEHLREEAQEIFVVLFLNARNEVTGYQEISRGTVSESLVHPREVFKGAVVHNAHSIICAHNHPTGLTDPSREDIDVTEKLVAAGKLIGISVVDHLVIGDDYTSIREQRPDIWY